MHRKGVGVAQDYVAAAKLYDAASTQDHAKAAANLANLYRSGLVDESALAPPPPPAPDASPSRFLRFASLVAALLLALWLRGAGAPPAPPPGDDGGAEPAVANK